MTSLLKSKSMKTISLKRNYLKSRSKKKPIIILNTISLSKNVGIFQDNPWDVSQLDDFLCYCCPECDEKCEEREAFIRHAQTMHPLSSTLLRKEGVISNLSDEEGPLNVTNVGDNIDLMSSVNPAKITLKFDVEEVYFNQGDDVKTVCEMTPVEAVKCYLCDEVMTKPDLTFHFLSNHRMSKELGGKPMKNVISRALRRTVDDDSEVQCYNCGAIMPHNEIRSHMINEKHSNCTYRRYGMPRNYQCLNCKKMFNTASDLDYHQCTVTYNATVPLIKDQNECPLCHEKMKTNETLRVHIIKTHGTHKKFKCAVCGFESSSLGDHSSHLSVNHTLKTFLCSVCPELVFESKSELDKHDMKKHRCMKRVSALETPLICEQCGKKFFLKDRLAVHVKHFHSRSEELKKCNNCLDSFCSAEELNSHSLLCLENPISAKCKFCPEEVSTIWNSSVALERHALDVHNQSNYVCDICGNMFSNRNKCNRHKKHIHEGIKFATCKVCDKSFEYHSTLKSHMKYVHLRDETFECEFCSYSCNVKHNFTKHVKVKHHVFMCNKCEKSYNSNELLNEHVNLEHPSFVN